MVLWELSVSLYTGFIKMLIGLPRGDVKEVIGNVRWEFCGKSLEIVST